MTDIRAAIATARVQAGVLLIDRVTVYRRQSDFTDGQMMRRTAWEAVEETDGIVQAPSPVEVLAAEGRKTAQDASVKLPVGTVARAGDVIAPTSGDLAGSRWLLGRRQRQSMEVLAKFPASEYVGEGDSWH